MSELKRTCLYDVHAAAGATMVDFGGWEMPVQYPTGIVAEHLYTRSKCSLFDVSHMGRLLVEGPDRVRFLQHVVSANVDALLPGRALYCILPDENGCAGDGSPITAIEVADSSVRFRVAVKAPDGNVTWYADMIGQHDTGGSDDDFAGDGWAPIVAVHMEKN